MTMWQINGFQRGVCHACFELRLASHNFPLITEFILRYISCLFYPHIIVWWRPGESWSECFVSDNRNNLTYNKYVTIYWIKIRLIGRFLFNMSWHICHNLSNFFGFFVVLIFFAFCDIVTKSSEVCLRSSAVVWHHCYVRPPSNVLSACPSRHIYECVSSLWVIVYKWIITEFG